MFSDTQAPTGYWELWEMNEMDFQICYILFSGNKFKIYKAAEVVAESPYLQTLHQATQEQKKIFACVVAWPLQGLRFDPELRWSFISSSSVLMGFLWFPPTSQKYAGRWTD